MWQDTRTQARINEMVSEDPGDGSDRFAATTGLPLATYFSASKIAWILDNVEGARDSAEAGDLLMGTIDTWVVWNLTGGTHGGIHVTDVTNASRTHLMDLHALAWSTELLETWSIPSQMLPTICSSSGLIGTVSTPNAISGVPIGGILGDQQAASFGHTAFDAGESKNTYGTGNFLLVNTGERVIHSKHGLLTTVAFRCEGQSARYALEGSVAVTGSLVQWLRDNLALIPRSEDVERFAGSVDDSGGAYFVPAFSGLFAPYWRPDARGALVGLTRYITGAHIARAALESTAFQTRDVVDAVIADTGRPIEELRVDGGMTRNGLLMQFQADILGIPIARPAVVEMTALGAAYAAGLAAGVWEGFDHLRQLPQDHARFCPRMPDGEREARHHMWRKAVSKSFDWVDA